MATKKHQQHENAKIKFARNQQIVGSLCAGWNAQQVADEYGLSYSWSKKLCSRLRKGECREKTWVWTIVKDNSSRRSVLNQRGCEAT